MNTTNTPTDQPHVMGEWVQADDSMFSLEFAPTTRPGVIALRDTFDQRDTIFATEKQLMKLAEAVDAGRTKNLFSH